MSASTAYILSAFLLAIALDWLIIRWWRRRREQNRSRQVAGFTLHKDSSSPSPSVLNGSIDRLLSGIRGVYLKITRVCLRRETFRSLLARFLFIISSLRDRVLGLFRARVEQFYARHHKGKLVLPAEVTLPEAKVYRVTVQPEMGSLLTAQWQLWLWASRALLKTAFKTLSLEAWLLLLSAGVYLVVHLIALPDFPIYFFCDEANQVNLAADFLHNNLKSSEGEFFPTYFYNVEKYNLGVSVYVQMIPYLLFGKSVFVTRAVTVLFSFLAALSLAGILKSALGVRYPWLSILVLSLIPAWFIHSRTAFETALMASFYAVGLYFYLLYRCRDPKWLTLSVIMFALAFYSYSPAQLIVLMSGVALALSDWGYHWQNRRVVLRALGLASLLALPYIRFRLNHPGALMDHLLTVSSYWVQPMPFLDKVKAFAKEYFYGLSPMYWFFPNGRDLMRHVWSGSGHIHVSMLPFWVLGIGIILKNIARPSYRAILLTFLVAPTGAALAQVSITRVLVMVIPGALAITLGISFLLEWLEQRLRTDETLSLATFACLSVASFWMLRVALVAGPTWFQDYGLYGMQYGARQLFAYVQAYLEAEPEAQLILSPSWANSTDVLARFFLPEPLPLRLGSIEEYFYRLLEITPQTVFIMTPQEYAKTLESGKFRDIEVLHTIDYPNGQPGFYFVRLAYVEGIKQILEKEREERRKLLSANLLIQGEQATVRYSLLDIGDAVHLFDGDYRSLARTFEANPFIIEIEFLAPRRISGLDLIVGDTRVLVSIWVYPPQAQMPTELHYELAGSVSNPMVSLDLALPLMAQKIRLEVRDLSQTEPGHVHLWEIVLK